MGAKWPTLDVKISSEILLAVFVLIPGQCQLSFSGLVLGQDLATDCSLTLFCSISLDLSFFLSFSPLG